MSTPLLVDRAALRARAGQKLGVSSWHAITQEQIDRFAGATGDRQWIHVDVERASRTPVGRTIAHGYLTLSLGPKLLDEVILVEDCSQVLNYGLNRVRFPSPVPVESRVRLHVDLDGVEETADASLQATFGLVFELEDADKPCCVAESLFRYYP
ncbi:MAG: MaoC family dehydratase [Gaiellales bacterium]